MKDIDAIMLLRMALISAQEKLKIYREHTSGEYMGGSEYSVLMKLIEKVLDDTNQKSTNQPP